MTLCWFCVFCWLKPIIVLKGLIKCLSCSFSDLHFHICRVISTFNHNICVFTLSLASLDFRWCFHSSRHFSCRVHMSLCLCWYLKPFNCGCFRAHVWSRPCVRVVAFVCPHADRCTCRREGVQRYTISIGPCSFSLWSCNWDWTWGAGNWGALICPLRRLPGRLKSLTSLAQTQEATTEYLWEVN